MLTGVQTGPILVVEDEEMLRLTLGDHLRDQGFEVLEAACGEEALAQFREHRPVLVTLDLRMSPMDGQEVLARIREADPDTPVIIISGQGQMSDVILALRGGAFDYLEKPITDMAILNHAVERALERSALKRDNAMLSRSFLAEGPERPEDFSGILTASTRMRDIFRYSEAIAQSGEPVLITGETGVGKELLAHALHRSSQRPGPLVAVNAAGLDEQAFSDTLFGHVRGAFTGADKPREGFMEKAAGGTLFLDEVGDLSPQAQLRLLRVLQEREYHPLGSDVSRPLRARILAATNKSVDELRASPNFRADFFYRLVTHSVSLPPLRERREDILPLLRHFLGQAAVAMRRPVPDCSPKLLDLLHTYPFPGNVRELKALAYDALGRLRSALLGPEAFPCLCGGGQESADVALPALNPFADLPALPTLRCATEALISEAMRRAGGVQKSAAFILGITPQSLCERLKRKTPA